MDKELPVLPSDHYGLVAEFEFVPRNPSDAGAPSRTGGVAGFFCEKDSRSEGGASGRKVRGEGKGRGRGEGGGGRGGEGGFGGQVGEGAGGGAVQETGELAGGGGGSGAGGGGVKLGGEGGLEVRVVAREMARLAAEKRLGAIGANRGQAEAATRHGGGGAGDAPTTGDAREMARLRHQRELQREAEAVLTVLNDA